VTGSTFSSAVFIVALPPFLIYRPYAVSRNSKSSFRLLSEQNFSVCRLDFCPTAFRSSREELLRAGGQKTGRFPDLPISFP
jgi:hypothetical protein